MSEPLDWNAKTIAEFRANEGRVGGVFEGAPIVLVHHRGRKSGREYVTPVMYLPHESCHPPQAGAPHTPRAAQRGLGDVGGADPPHSTGPSPSAGGGHARQH